MTLVSSFLAEEHEEACALWRIALHLAGNGASTRLQNLMQTSMPMENKPIAEHPFWNRLYFLIKSCKYMCLF